MTAPGSPAEESEDPAGNRRAVIRGLRGIVLHVIPRAMEYEPARLGRDPIGVNLWNADRRRRGNCLWCHQPTLSSERRWHQTCIQWYTAARGRRQTAGRTWVVRRQPCLCGMPGEELDHRVPIMLAARRGLRDYVRAFLLSNLQWLCRECHRRKTAGDTRAIAGRRAGRIRMF